MDYRVRGVYITIISLTFKFESENELYNGIKPVILHLTQFTSF